MGSPLLPTCPAAVSPRPPRVVARRLLRGHLLDVVTEQLVLLWGGERRGLREAAEPSHPHSIPPESQKGAAHPPGSPLPSSKLPMVACFFRKSLQSFLLRPKASMLWMKVLREDRDALGEREWPGWPFFPPPSSPSPQPPVAGTGMMLSSVPLDIQQKGQEQIPGRSIKDPLHHKGCPQLGNTWEVSPHQQLVPRGW